MEAVYSWAKNLIVCLCLLELFCHLVQKEDYRRYIRFFGGLVILLLVLSPFTNLLSVGESFEAALEQAFAREEIREMQIAQESLAGLQNEEIEKAYQKELKRQMEEIVNMHGQQAVSVDLHFKSLESSTALTGADIVLAAAKSAPGDAEDEERARKRQKESAESIRTEIASIYGIGREDIIVSVKE